MLGQQGPDAWFDIARTFALNVTRQADNDPNPLPLERQRVEQFSPLVARRIAALFEVTTEESVEVVTRSQLALIALDQWKPLVQPLLDRPSPSMPSFEGAEQLLGQLASRIGPLFTGFQLGSVAGHFADRAWSLGSLALPRTTAHPVIAVNNVQRFQDEWSLAADETTVFAVACEIAASVILSQPGTGDALRALLLDSVRESADAQGDLLQSLGEMVDLSHPESMLSDPEALLDRVGSPAESDATRAINAATSVIRAVVDAVAFSVTSTIVGPTPLLREAYRRHRRADARGEDAAASLFGIDPHGSHLGAAEEFVAQIEDRNGLGAFTALLRADGLPAWSELGRPLEWLERVRTSPLA
jgi:uncharacterized protein (DUF2342 family)